MSLRKTIFWLHLIGGLIAGVVILLLSATGVILAFERQIVAKSEAYKVEVPAGVSKLPMDTLLAKALDGSSNAMPSMITVRAEADAPVMFSFGKEKNVAINPYTGQSLAEGAARTRGFFAFVTELHRWLATSTEYRALGKGITGAGNLVFLFLVTSGVYLWWPRQWTRSALKAITRFNFALSGKARDWNWHNVIGFWCALPLLFIVSTGVIMSYAWANNLLYRLTGNEIPPPQRPGGDARKEGEKGRGPASRSGDRPAVVFNTRHFNDMWLRAGQHVPDWKSITLRLPASGEAPSAFTIDLGNGARPDLRSTLNFNSKTGQVISYESYESQNLGRKLRLWSRWIHTGEAFGLVGQVIAALASLGGIFLVWTGIALAVRRFQARKKVESTVDQPPQTVSPLK